MTANFVTTSVSCLSTFHNKNKHDRTSRNNFLCYNNVYVKRKGLTMKYSLLRLQINRNIVKSLKSGGRI